MERAGQERAVGPLLRPAFTPAGGLAVGSTFAFTSRPPVVASLPPLPERSVRFCLSTSQFAVTLAGTKRPEEEALGVTLSGPVAPRHFRL